MGWADTYTIADGNASPVNQIYNRVKISDNYVKYVNDTARALGIEEFFEFRRSDIVTGSGLTAVKSQRWNCKWSSRVLATETIPFVISWTETISDALSIAVASALIRFKSGRNVINSMSDSDTKIGFQTASRVL